MRRFFPSVWVTSFVLFAAACNPGEVSVTTHQDEPVSSALVAPPNEPIAKGIPHGGQIVEVAVTERADAALTFDNLLGVRLWPSLDGTRPPIPVSADAPDSLSLAHVGERDLLAVILDDADTVRVVRLGLDGRVHGRSSLPGQYAQAIAIDDGVVARTPDHGIEWYAADGTLRGRVVPEPGTQVRTIVTRHGEVAALIADAKLGTARTLRYLTLRDSLEWGVSVQLDSPVRDGTIALSPSGHRIAYVDLANTVQVYEIDLLKRAVPGALVTAREDAREIGFYDDDHVAIGGNDIVTWSASPKQEKVLTNDPWASASFVTSMVHQPLEMAHLVDGFAVADKLVVTGYGSSALALDDLSRTRYLGWQASGAGTMLSPAGSQLVMALSGSRFVWLDDKLTSVRDVELRPGGSGPWIYGAPLDEHHVVTQTSDNGRYVVELVDLDTKAHSTISHGDFERMEYSPDSHMLAIMYAHKISRYQLDLASNTVTELPAIRIKGSAVNVRLFDPAVAGGITAAVTGWDSDFANNQTLTIYRGKNQPLRIHPFNGQLLDARADGTMFVFDRTGRKPELRVMKGKTVIRKTAMAASVTAAINADASRIAYIADNAVVMVDATGAELWRQSLWSAQQVTFTADGTKLFVRAMGGIAILDATTGIRTALECGWNFGVTDQAIATNPIGMAPVCEDPMLQ
ncbi:MAG TPA: hypothetical protein VLB44_10995 [Kofleriaceae bacterium]|nr:hypothetical protein [Kofleriaceae bacterium]